MRSRILSVVAAVTALAVFFDCTSAFARGGRGGGSGGGGGRGGGGGGSFSKPSGGGGHSRPSGSASRPSSSASRPPSSSSRPSGSSSRPSGGNVSRPSQVPSGGSSRPSSGRVPTAPAKRPPGWRPVNSFQGQCIATSIEQPSQRSATSFQAAGQACGFWRRGHRPTTLETSDASRRGKAAGTAEQARCLRPSVAVAQ
jgi:hypothetical protein